MPRVACIHVTARPRRTASIATTVVAALLMVASGSAPARAQASRDSIRHAHRGLQIATMTSLLVTGTLGTFVAINQPTLFSDGRCDQDDAHPLFGRKYGCHGLNVLHGLSAIISSVLYTATQTMEFTAFDWPGQESHGTGYKVASGIHLAGMIALPIVGLVTAVPQLLGIRTDNDSKFERIIRTLHLSLGYLTVGTYVTTAGIDLR